MREPRGINRRALLLLHAETLAEHGGLSGMRDEGLLDSAMARPRNHFAYNAKCDLADLAAAYAFGLSQNHPSRDGNKRVGFLATGLFLEPNGFEFVPEQVAAVEVFFALAAGKIKEKELAGWIHENSRRIGQRKP
jgi:death-on-curing protein